MIKPKKCIENIIPYNVEKYEDYKLKLDFNENLIGPSPKVLEAIKNINYKTINFYPAYENLISEIAKFNKVAENMIVATNGADEAFKYIYDAFINPNDEILSVTPAFSMPKQYAITAGANFIEIPYKEKWIFPIEDFLNRINDTTKMIMLTSPNSPTGDVLEEKDIEAILQKAQNSAVVIDETYASYYGVTHVNLIEKYENLIIIKSMSKDFAIAGLRLGYIISKSENINQIRKIVAPYSVNSIAALAGTISLQDKSHLQYVKDEISKSKEYLMNELPRFAKNVYKSFANFILVDFGEQAEFYYKKLLFNGIKTKFFKTGECKNCFRLTIPKLEDAKKIISILEAREMIVFDMDGVLIDATNSYRKAIEKTFEFFAGKQTTPQAIQDVKNLGGYNNDWDLTEYLLNQEGIKPDKNLLIQKFQELYFGENGEGLISKENLLIKKEELDKLSKKYDLAIFTGRPIKEAFFALKKFDIEKYFLYIITSDDLPPDKQKPDGMGLEIIKIVANPSKLFYMGDTRDDILAAVAAGVIPIGVLPPSDKSDNLRKIMLNTGAKTVLNNAADFINIGDKL